MNKQPIIERALGKLQIYVKPKDKVEPTGLIHRLHSRQLYRELVKLAKDDQLMNASVYRTHHGYSMHGRIQASHVELENSELTMCIELVDEKPKLEAFCTKHAGLLQDKMIIFKAVEVWQIN